MLLSVAEDRKYFIRQLLRYIACQNINDEIFFYLDSSKAENHNRNYLIKFIVETRNLRDAIMNDSGATLLHFAVQNHNVEITNYLVEQGLDVNVQDKHGNTPLMHVLLDYKKRFVDFVDTYNRGKVIQIIDTLFKCGANYHLSNNNGLNAFALALNLTMDIIKLFLKTLEMRCQNDKELIAKTLVDNDCLLEHVILLNDPGLTKTMISCGCPVNKHQIGVGSTPLHVAVKFMSLKNVQVLIAHGADVLAEDNRGLTPLQYYLSSEHYGDIEPCEEPEIVRTLLNVIENVNRRCSSGGFIVRSVARNGNEEALLILLQYEVDFYAQDNRGCTLLHHFAENSEPSVARLLRGRVFDPNIRDYNGNTALVNAVSELNTSTTKFLLESGADPVFVNPSNGCCPIQYAANRSEIVYGHDYHFLRYTIRRSIEEIIALLLDYGAKVPWSQRTFFIQFFNSSGINTTADMLLAHLAIDETLGESIETRIRKQISSDSKLQSHFDNYKQQLVKMKKIIVYGALSMFTLLSEGEKSIARRYAYNLELLEKLEDFNRKRHPDTYYDRLAIERLARIISNIKLIQKASLIICSLICVEKTVDSIIVREIISYLDYVDTVNLNKVELE